MTIDYSKGLIYKLCCKDKNITEVYVGSAVSYKSRKRNHKSCCNNVKDKNHNLKIYKFIRENGGWSDWEMIQLEEYPCENKRQLERREEQIRCELNAKLNGKRCYITEEEKAKYYEQNKDKMKKYANQRLCCPYCGCGSSRSVLRRHQKSKKCLAIQNSDMWKNEQI